MPTWGQLTESERVQVTLDRVNGTDLNEIWAQYNITNPESAARRIRGRINTLRQQLNVSSPEPGQAAENEPVQRMLNAFIQYQHAINAIRSERVVDNLDITIHDDKPTAFAFPADWHVGATGTDHELLIEHCEMMGRTVGLHTIIGGDIIENMIHPKIVEQSGADMPPDAQYEVVAYLMGLAKPDAVAHGNHSDWTMQFAGVDMLAEIAGEQNVVCTADGAEIGLHVGKQLYTVYRQHKYKYNSSFNLTHSVKRLWEMGICDFDIGIVEHHHVPAMEPFYKHAKLRYAIRTGTYKTRDDWARRQGFFGVRVGVPIVFLWPNEWRMQLWPAMDDVAGACKYLEYLRQ